MSQSTATHITQLAGTIAAQAEAIEQDTVIGPLPAAVKRLADNVELLKAWVELDEVRATNKRLGISTGDER
jgi:hypothetical protein